MTVIRDVAVILLAMVVAMGAVTAVAVGVAMWARRRWHRKKAALALHVQGIAVAASVAGLRWLWTRPLPSRDWRRLQRSRRRLLKSVDAAVHAVDQARSAGAPLGDLESLCRRLAQAADPVERSLRIAQHSAAPSGAARDSLRQAHELTVAADRIHQAALDQLTASMLPVTTQIADHVRIESLAMKSH